MLYSTKADDVDGGQEASAFKLRERQKFQQAQDDCKRSLSNREFYAFFQQLGFGYGPTFQRLDSVKYDGDELALADVPTYRWPNERDQDFRQPHLIHPATLDAIMQTSLVPLSRGLENLIPALVPTRLGRLWMKSDGISFPAVENVAVYSEAALLSRRKARMCVSAAESLAGDTVLSISNLECSALSTDDTSADRDVNDRPLCYEMIWKPDIDLMDASQISLHCEAARPRPPDNAVYFRKLGFLLTRYIYDVLDSTSEAHLSNLPQYLQRYIEWARSCQKAFVDGSFTHIDPADPTWKNLLSDPKYRQTVFKEINDTGQGNFFNKIGSKLPAIFSGDLDPLQFMFADDSVSRFYQEVNEKVICYEPLARSLDLLTHKNPSLKILEVGAGTGASTDYILDMLASQAADGHSHLHCLQYDFTDVSPAFFEAAIAKYALYGNRMKFFVFDAEKDAAEQNMADASYDVIIAASVLHATKSLDATMRNIRRLLKPDGKLILFEVVKETMRASFAFGLLPGWWLGQEGNRRLRPWISTGDWNDLMRRTGFSGVDQEIKDHPDDACHEYSILVSTAAEEESTEAAATSDGFARRMPVTMITGGDQFQNSIAELLEKMGRANGFECQTVSCEALQEAKTFGERYYISLCEISQSVLSAPSDYMFLLIKRLLLKASRILWITGGGGEGENDPSLHIVDGLARTACTEIDKLAFSTMAIHANGYDPDKIAAKIFTAFRKSLGESSDDFEPEYREHNDSLHISRIVSSPGLEKDVMLRKSPHRRFKRQFGHNPPLTLKIGSLGLLDSLHFVEDIEHEKPVARGSLEIKVASSGVNFRDCLTALGQVDTDFLGCECAGVVSKVGKCREFSVGDRVAAMFVNSYGMYARGPVEHAVRIPDNMPFIEASASLAIFTTAWHCLVEVAHMQKGESVLIHSGAGGTGQAAIQTAKYLGADIYVTVGELQKKHLIATTYGIPESHIFYSRNTTFAQGVTRETAGRGVDVVLNSLSGDMLLTSWECIAPVSTSVIRTSSVAADYTTSVAVLWK